MAAGQQTITAANSVFILTIPGLFDQGQRLQGYAAEAAFETEEATNAELVLGVDAQLSSGWIPYTTDQRISIMPDSPSSDIFEQWIEAEKVALEKLPARATISLVSIGRKYDLSNGFLTRFPPIASARKVLQARVFTVTWGRITPAPV